MKASPKILLVDDNADNLKALEVVLRGLDAELIKVTNGNDALKATLHHDFALALLDVQMPEMDGYELANILKTEEKTENLPFIFISAVYTDHQNISKGYTQGAYNFFAKPFDPETLIRSVELFIDKYNRAALQTALDAELDARNREIEQKNNELEKINTELQSFVHIASHDLKEPLRKIYTFTTLISESEVLSEKGTQYFTRIQAAVTNMQNLIDDLLSYSETSSSKHSFELTNLNDIVKSVLDEFKETLEQKNVIVVVDGLGHLKIIRYQFQQLFHNLLSNAIKYSSVDRILQVNIRCESVKGVEVRNMVLPPLQQYWHISFADNGIGFDGKYTEKIFEIFQRLHDKNAYSGTGIGLAIVKKVVENHNGVIMASSLVNQGTSFHIYLPK